MESFIIQTLHKYKKLHDIQKWKLKLSNEQTKW